jgi:hypothetical protein
MISEPTSLTNKMSDGTSLEDIETGNIQHSADDSYMNAILMDMNAVEEPVQQAPVYIPPPMPQVQMPQPDFQMQPQQPQQPMQYQHYEQPYQQPYEQPYQQPYQQQNQQEPTYERVEEPAPRKNSWYNLFEEMRDPLVVGLLVCLFSLPALHTWLAKYVTWAYKVGGSLSWLGFLIQFALVSGIFAMYRQIMLVTGA